MRLEQTICNELVDSILAKLEPELEGWGGYNFDNLYTEPAGFAIVLSGDWKHMHKRADNLVKKFAAEHSLFVKIYETEIGYSDSDWYEAQHKYMFRKTEPKPTKDELALLNLFTF